MRALKVLGLMLVLQLGAVAAIMLLAFLLARFGWGLLIAALAMIALWLTYTVAQDIARYRKW
jgi:hypothetical protein